MASAVDLRVNADAAGAVDAAAAHIAEYARNTIVKRRYAHLGFSGGSTGALLVRALAGADLDWSRVMVRQIDERVAPDGDAARNATALRAELLDRVPIPERNILLMDVTAADLVRFLEAARRGELLDAEFTEEFFTPQVEHDEATRYGFGLEFDMNEDGTVRSYYKEGINNGASGIVRHYLAEGLDIVVLSNSEEGAWPIIRDLDERLGG